MTIQFFFRTNTQEENPLLDDSLKAHSAPQSPDELVSMLTCSEISTTRYQACKQGVKKASSCQLYEEGKIDEETNAKLEKVEKKNTILRARRASVAAMHFKAEKISKLKETSASQPTKKLPPVNRTKSMGSYNDCDKNKQLSRHTSFRASVKRQESQHSSDLSVTWLDEGNGDTSMFKLNSRRAPVGTVSQVIGDLSVKLTKAGGNVAIDLDDHLKYLASRTESIKTRIRSLSVDQRLINDENEVYRTRRSNSCDAEMVVESFKPDISEYLKQHRRKAVAPKAPRVRFQKAVMAVRAGKINDS